MGAVLAAGRAIGPVAAGKVVAYIAKATPDVIDVVAREVSKNGNVVIRTAKQIAAYVQASPAKAALVIATIADLGITVSGLFDDEPVSGRPSAASQAATAELDAILDKDADVKLELGSGPDVALGLSLISFVKRTFGLYGSAQIVEFHRMVRLLAELDTETVSRLARLSEQRDYGR